MRMNLSRYYLTEIATLFILAWGLPGFSLSQTLPATITVNAGTTVTAFIPISILFGNNVGPIGSATPIT